MSSSYSFENEFKRKEKIGQGTFGIVYKIAKFDGKLYAMKTFKKAKTSDDFRRIDREESILKELKDTPFIIPLLKTMRDQKTGKKSALVFPYIDNKNPQKIYRGISANGVRHYMYQLLQAIYYCHRLGIIHGDVKSKNLLFDSGTKKLCLIDFGQARHEDDKLSYHVGTLSYKAPELLLKTRDLTTAVDIFSAGRVFMDMLIPESHDEDEKIVDTYNTRNEDNRRRYKQFCFWMKVLGNKPFRQLEHEFGKDSKGIPIPDTEEFPLRKWLKKLNPKRYKTHCTRDALDLLTKMLQVNPSNRITASEALSHPYFQ